MNKAMLVLGLAAVLCVGGCVIVAGNDGLYADGSCPKSGSIGTTIAEIDAVSKIKTESVQMDGFRTVAGRKGLCPAERRHLSRAIDKSSLPQASKDELQMMLVLKPGESRDVNCPLKK